MEGPQPPVVDRLVIARGGSAQYYDRRLPATLLHPFPIRPAGWHRQGYGPARDRDSTEFCKPLILKRNQ
jgi:hypothetical protein